MKLLITFLILTTTIFFSVMTLSYMNKIISIKNFKKKDFENSMKTINEVEGILALPLDSFLNEATVKKTVSEEMFDLFIFEYEEFDYIYYVEK